MKVNYARMHVLLARDSLAGLVVRHGTAKSVCTLSWNRKTDEFQLGQWIRGRIDLATCDLSPDGSYFLYTATKQASYRFVWTAVSRTPYLRAVAYYPWRRWGGWFRNRHEYCVPGELEHAEDLESPAVQRVFDDCAPEPSLYGARLVRGGWTMDDLRSKFVRRVEFFRPAGAGWELRHVPGRSYQMSCGEIQVDTSEWEWADVDRKRVVWTSNGCLWAGTMRRDGIQDVRLLRDFTA